ncbi:hypothetical protein KBB59_02860 [Candidatus Woesebacteria bacterium]|jgi:cellobiose phosphorylase|nr:hypothetical protein [Candidatus Woesebacteria bacterium]HOA12262.1 hypothetical protein [Candidatus Woesebacteria bacterium]HOC07499.1 hypothetical protein [Candidatus Woesebacteria bacterium]HOI05311.1 hypothetical protein [Candidatus Woesebacteria bacterium]HOP39283.1 hypothetical protein [Candidatus Woesebacteria bacterium]
MNKKIRNYYRIVFLLMMIQLISTVANLSKNIAYGQQIEVLKEKQELLISKESQLNQLIAEEISIRQLAEYPGFEDTNNLIVVTAKDNALALR